MLDLSSAKVLHIL